MEIKIISQVKFQRPYIVLYSFTYVLSPATVWSRFLLCPSETVQVRIQGY